MFTIGAAIGYALGAMLYGLFGALILRWLVKGMFKVQLTYRRSYWTTVQAYWAGGVLGLMLGVWFPTTNLLSLIPVSFALGLTVATIIYHWSLEKEVVLDWWDAFRLSLAVCGVGIAIWIGIALVVIALVGMVHILQ